MITCKACALTNCEKISIKKRRGESTKFTLIMYAYTRAYIYVIEGVKNMEISLKKCLENSNKTAKKSIKIQIESSEMTFFLSAKFEIYIFFWGKLNKKNKIFL